MHPFLRTNTLLALALLTGCYDPADGRDRDGDGFETWELGGDDCDDNNANVNPSSSELCGNGLDDDCDGFIDDNGVGARSWFLDEDGDGFAAPTEYTGCSAPADALPDLTRGIDCNDDDDDTYPGAPEVWYDGFDQGCDGGNDYDADGDGFDGVAGGGDDCDDDNEVVNPGSLEICGNGWDDDCDGTPNHCLRTGLLDVADIASMTFPTPSMRQWHRDLTGDGVKDVLLLHRPPESGGRLELELYDASTVPIAANASWPVDDSVDGLGRTLPHVDADLNGDGIADIVTTQESANGFQELVVYLSPHAGRASDTPDARLHAQADGLIQHVRTHSLTTVPDQDGDLADELLWLGRFDSSATEAKLIFSSDLTTHFDLLELPGLNDTLDDGMQVLGSRLRSDGTAIAITQTLLTSTGAPTGVENIRSTAFLLDLRQLPLDSGYSLTTSEIVTFPRVFSYDANDVAALPSSEMVGGRSTFLPTLSNGLVDTETAPQVAGLLLLDDTAIPLEPTTLVPASWTTGVDFPVRTSICEWLQGELPMRLELRATTTATPLRLEEPALYVQTLGLSGSATVVAEMPSVTGVSCGNDGRSMFLVTDDATHLVESQGM